MAHQPTSLKILAIGAPLSDLSTFQAKVTSINAKHGPFDACLVVGDFFKQGSDGSELDGLALPVPTYFTIGQNALPDVVRDKIRAGSGEVTDNLVFLGASSILTTAQGLKIGSVGGQHDVDHFTDAATDSTGPFISKQSLQALLDHPLFAPTTSAPISLANARTVPLPSAFQGLDILLLPSAPPNINLLSSSFPASGVSLSSLPNEVKDLVTKARPRYIFWADEGAFWEREPFGWNGLAGEERWTRAVKLGSLGGVAEGKKPRWFYAFTLPPQTPDTPLPVKPANTTSNPYTLPIARPTLPSGLPIKSESLPGEEGESNIVKGKKRAALEGQEDAYGDRVKREKTEHGPPPENYICKICSTPGHWIQDCPQKTVTDPSKPREGYKCKICQSPDHHVRDCPDKEAHDRAQHGSRGPPKGYKCRACGATEQHFLRECPVVLERQEMKNKRKELGPAECWFCLSNPKVTKHLITSIGSETYVTLPKGQLIPTLPRHIAQGGSNPLVPGGGHVLIIPIAHHPTLLSIPAEDALPIISEIEATKSALTRCYAQYGAVPVIWEIGRLTGRGGHAHVQVVPVPQDLAGKVEDAFRKAGESQGIDFEADPEKALSRAGKAGNYFKVDLPGGGKMVHMLKGNFDLQFGRMVLAGLLGLHHRIDWKDCGQSEAEEKEDALKFKKAFAPFQSS